MRPGLDLIHLALLPNGVNVERKFYFHHLYQLWMSKPSAKFVQNEKLSSFCERLWSTHRVNEEGDQVDQVDQVDQIDQVAKSRHVSKCTAVALRQVVGSNIIHDLFWCKEQFYTQTDLERNEH
jgi:hypothetical protein